MTCRLTMHRITFFLDRFEERLELDCEQMKRQLVAQVDQQFGVLRAKVHEIRNCFGGRGGQTRSNNIDLQFDDDPLVVIVSHDNWIQERNAIISMDQPSSSSGRKRHLPTQSTTSKKHKTNATVDAPNKKHACKYHGCDRAFISDAELARHERIHLGIKPYSCSWPNCGFSAEKRSDVVRHVRMRHFKLPQTLKQQYLLNIEDNRDANEYVLVDNQLKQRRLE